MSRAIVFPGQGSQAVGMGKDLAEAFPAAREVFQEVDDALEQRLSKLMFSRVNPMGLRMSGPTLNWLARIGMAMTKPASGPSPLMTI